MHPQIGTQKHWNFGTCYMHSLKILKITCTPIFMAFRRLSVEYTAWHSPKMQRASLLPTPSDASTSAPSPFRPSLRTKLVGSWAADLILGGHHGSSSRVVCCLHKCLKATSAARSYCDLFWLTISVLQAGFIFQGLLWNPCHVSKMYKAKSTDLPWCRNVQKHAKTIMQ